MSILFLGNARWTTLNASNPNSQKQYFSKNIKIAAAITTFAALAFGAHWFNSTSTFLTPNPIVYKIVPGMNDGILESPDATFTPVSNGNNFLKDKKNDLTDSEIDFLIGESKLADISTRTSCFKKRV